MSDKDLKICPMPWTQCYIHAKEISSCCPNFTYGYSFGNLEEQSFEEIWNGERANFFRNEMLSGEFLLCDRKMCTFKDNWLVDASFIKENYYDKNGNVKYPKTLKMANDFECNVACITCRDNLFKNNSEHSLRLDNTHKKMTSALNNAEILNISGNGDPFASKYSRNILKETAKNNPNIKFEICTNGILMTKEMCDNLGITDKINLASISLPGATEETYNKIVKYGNFKKVLKNIEWISKQDNIYDKEINFVIHQINYKEIPNIVELAEKYNFRVNLTNYYHWRTTYGSDYESVAVWLPEHKEHQEFLDVLNLKIVKEHKKWFNEIIASLIV